MDVVTQIVFITYSLIMLASGFMLVGKKPQYDNLRQGFAILTVLYGFFTIAFLIWWEPVTLVEGAARWVSIGLMWGPFLIDFPKMNHKPHVITAGEALSSAALNVIRLGLVLTFWVL